MNNDIILAQISTIPCAVEKNAQKIIEIIEKAKDNSIIIFPHLALTGSHIEDVIERFPFIVKQNEEALKKITQKTSSKTVILSYIKEENDYFTSTYAIIQDKKIKKIILEDETDNIVEIYGKNYLISFSSFENIEKTDAIINLTPTLSRTGAEFERNETLLTVAQIYKKPLIYVNQVGAIDNFSYDGASRIYNEKGEVIARAKSFEEDILVTNLEQGGEINPLPKGSEKTAEKENFSTDYSNDLERTYKTIIQATRSYFKTCGLKRAILGLSGGLDSTVCAVILADALGKENVFGVSMPSKITSSESKTDAETLAKNLGIGFSTIPIADLIKPFNEAVEPLIEDTSKHFKNAKLEKSYAQDNIQARTRATILFGLSNEFASSIPIATSDKSEFYMGYATINGDMSGGFAPISDVTKTKLFALARWMNENREEKNAIPESIILKKPGAELAINPKTGKPLQAEEALMPYEFLDEIIWRIEEKNQTYSQMLKEKFFYEEKNNISKELKTEWLDKFFNRMSKAHYKGYIMPPSVIVDSHSINKAEYTQPITTCQINYKY